MVRIGEGISDIAYFLATYLSPKTRKANEVDMIIHYIDCLRTEDSITPDSDLSFVSTVEQKNQLHSLLCA